MLYKCKEVWEPDFHVATLWHSAHLAAFYMDWKHKNWFCYLQYKLETKKISSFPPQRYISYPLLTTPSLPVPQKPHKKSKEADKHL